MLMSTATHWKNVKSYLTNNREALVNNALQKSNQRHINYDFFVQQWVLKYANTIKGKLANKISGPFEIVRIYMNATVTIQLWVGVTEQINICHTIS